ncbi:chromosome partitioning protein [Cellulomonas wangsupingiae]|uniref:Chromosome partitioning protein n=1 Tax=Cellulomonas wangsupingiae TaxID=2968085 RepID=A0ABY5K898_9CELL|nr:chromosome partitioning protein [Cellulomonas wangsupingiae]MCC2335125.1 chromosome partitioning protein [Cellulomonas wangsupingiae]MCM0638994.1 chromosome partitioning protein [Cellulomonas wangsupingiae]UUI65621.1 chromosome partitioning protein [Cellulomonas wangsupingiae]
MSEHLPDSFDEKQPDLPSLGVDPDPIPDDHEGNAPDGEGEAGS